MCSCDNASKCLLGKCSVDPNLGVSITEWYHWFRKMALYNLFIARSSITSCAFWVRSTSDRCVVFDNPIAGQHLPEGKVYVRKITLMKVSQQYVCAFPSGSKCFLLKKGLFFSPLRFVLCEPSPLLNKSKTHDWFDRDPPAHILCLILPTEEVMFSVGLLTRLSTRLQTPLAQFSWNLLEVWSTSQSKNPLKWGADSNHEANKHLIFPHSQNDKDSVAGLYKTGDRTMGLTKESVCARSNILYVRGLQ